MSFRDKPKLLVVVFVVSLLVAIVTAGFFQPETDRIPLERFTMKDGKAFFTPKQEVIGGYPSYPFDIYGAAVAPRSLNGTISLPGHKEKDLPVYIGEGCGEVGEKVYLGRINPEERRQVNVSVVFDVPRDIEPIPGIFRSEVIPCVTTKPVITRRSLAIILLVVLTVFSTIFTLLWTTVETVHEGRR